MKLETIKNIADAMLGTLLVIIAVVAVVGVLVVPTLLWGLVGALIGVALLIAVVTFCGIYDSVRQNGRYFFR